MNIKKYSSNLKFQIVSQIFAQAKKRFNAALFAKEGPLQEGRLLLEKEERWKNHQRGSYEAESARDGGEHLFEALPNNLIRRLSI